MGTGETVETAEVVARAVAWAVAVEVGGMEAPAAVTSWVPAHVSRAPRVHSGSVRVESPGARVD